MAYSKQTWDTTSYVNPTRMNHIEQGIYDASTATGTEYSSGVSVKDMIDGNTYTESKTSDANGVIITNISTSKKLFGYTFGNYLLMPFASSGIWKFVVCDIGSNNGIVAQANITSTLVVYHSI